MKNLLYEKKDLWKESQLLFSKPKKGYKYLKKDIQSVVCIIFFFFFIKFSQAVIYSSNEL